LEIERIRVSPHPQQRTGGEGKRGN